MGSSTMVSPNRAQASEFLQSPLNLAHFDDYLMSQLNNKSTCKMNMVKAINNGKQFQDPTSSSSSFSKIILPYGFGQGAHANDECLGFNDSMSHPGAINPDAINTGFNEGWPPYLLEAKSEVPHQLAHTWSPYEPSSINLLGSSFPMFDDETSNSVFYEGQHPGMPAMPMTMVKPTPLEKNPNDEIKVKGVERKQKRMIKNRESAARSRARKQAYIKQLEATVKKLEDTNLQLKRQLEEMPSHLDSTPETRRQLRRTCSNQFN